MRPFFYAACALLMWALAILDVARQHRLQHAQPPAHTVQPPSSPLPAMPDGPYEVVPIPNVRGEDLDDEAKAMTIRGEP